MDDRKRHLCLPSLAILRSLLSHIVASLLRSIISVGKVGSFQVPYCVIYS